MQQGGRSYTPNFYITINGYDFTKFTRAWQLNDVDDGISTITVTLVNPDGVISGYIRTETELTLRYGYYDGSMSKPVTMKIKDLTEKYPTKHGSEIIVTAYDGTERLVGLTHAGNSTPDMKLEDAIKSLGDGVKLKMDIQAKGPDKPPEKIPLHNMSSHSAVRWIMGHMKCTKEGGGGGEDNPIDGQKEYDAGSGFKSAESVTGDRNPRSMLEAKKKELADIWIKNNKKKAGDSVITGRLEVVGHPGLEAKKRDRKSVV